MQLLGLCFLVHLNMGKKQRGGGRGKRWGERGMEKRWREEREREEGDGEEGERGGKLKGGERDLISFTIPPVFHVCAAEMYVKHACSRGPRGSATLWYSSAMSVPSPVAKQNSILVNLASVMLTECT